LIEDLIMKAFVVRVLTFNVSLPERLDDAGSGDSAVQMAYCTALVKTASIAGHSNGRREKHDI
jgi:hypothetical protein